MAHTMRRTSSSSQHPPTGMDWEVARHASTLSPSSEHNDSPENGRSQPQAEDTKPKSDTTWHFSPQQRHNPKARSFQRITGWLAASALGRDGFLAAALASNPRGDALPQFWMLQRGVVVFLAISFNACLGQALRAEPLEAEVHSIVLWRVSTTLFSLGSMASLCAVGAFAWMGIAFSNVPKKKFPSFVAQNGWTLRAIIFLHFVSFSTALFGTFVRILAEHPFWLRDMEVSSRLIGISAILGLFIFIYGVVALLHLFSVTICDQFGFEDEWYPGLCQDTNVVLQGYLAKANRDKGTVLAKDKQIQRMKPEEVSKWLPNLDERLAPLCEIVIKEHIEGSAIQEMANMTAVDAMVYFASLFHGSPRGLGVTLWKLIREED